MSMKSVGGGDMPFKKGQLHAAAKQIQAERSDLDGNEFEVTFDAVRAKLQELGYSNERIDRLEELESRQGKMRFNLDAKPGRVIQAKPVRS